EGFVDAVSRRLAQRLVHDLDLRLRNGGRGLGLGEVLKGRLRGRLARSAARAASRGCHQHQNNAAGPSLSGRVHVVAPFRGKLRPCTSSSFQIAHANPALAGSARAIIFQFDWYIIGSTFRISPSNELPAITRPSTSAIFPARRRPRNRSGTSTT